MWIPKTATELEMVVNRGHISESASLDFKRDLGKKNIEIAKDIAAMSTDGGVIIYGVGEDSDKRPTLLNPIPLEGVPERISAVVRSGLHDPPEVSIKELRIEIEPAKGYLVVHVPPSPRAPHMVLLNGENRYYGRDDRRNIPLTGGEVERLFERRAGWQKAPEALLNTVMENSPFRPDPNFGHLYVVAEPVMKGSGELLEKALGSVEAQTRTLSEIVNQASLESRWKRGYPSFRSGPVSPTSDGLLVTMDEPAASDPRQTDRVLDIEFQFEGRSTLFCGNAADRLSEGEWGPNPPLILFEENIAGWTYRHLAVLGKIYELGEYFGPVNLGLAVTGIEGAFSYWEYERQRSLALRKTPYLGEQYRRTTRAAAQELRQSPEAVADRLLNRLFRATTQGKYQPFVAEV